MDVDVVGSLLLDGDHAWVVVTPTTDIVRRHAAAGRHHDHDGGRRRCCDGRMGGVCLFWMEGRAGITKGRDEVRVKGWWREVHAVCAVSSEEWGKGRKGVALGFRDGFAFTILLSLDNQRGVISNNGGGQNQVPGNLISSRGDHWGSNVN